MRNTLKLNNPLLVNGKEYTELEYDALKITAEQFVEASTRSAALDKNRSITFKMKENDYAFHQYLGFMAVIACNPEISVEDLERLTGYDVLNLVDIGTLFIYRKSGVISEENNSDEQ